MSSIDSSGTTAAQSEYRDGPLYNNGIAIEPYRCYLNSQEMQNRLPEAKALVHLLASAIDPNVQLDHRTRDRLNSGIEPFTTSEGGYTRKEVIEQAVILYDAAPKHEDADKSVWSDLMRENVWNFFSLSKLFSLSQHHSWRAWDPALAQLIPERPQLSRPKPDFAIGLMTRPTPRSDFDRMTDTYKFHSVPAVDLFVRAKRLAFPFFICEFTSEHGSVRTAVNQLANSMVMAHDILCSLDAQDDLYILGLVQAADICKYYVSFSTRSIDEEGKPYTRDVRIIHIANGGLHDVSGCLSLLRFVEHVKEYGQTTFSSVIHEKLASASPPTP